MYVIVLMKSDFATAVVGMLNVRYTTTTTIIVFSSTLICLLEDPVKSGSKHNPSIIQFLS